MPSSEEELAILREIRDSTLRTEKLIIEREKTYQEYVAKHLELEQQQHAYI